MNGDLEKRNLTVDFIRGILAVNICLFHFAYGTLSLTDGNLLAKFSVWNPFRYHLFFLLSGFTIPYMMNKHGYTIDRFGKFIFRRWTRLAPAAYVAVAAMVLLQLASIAVKGRPVNGIPFPGLQWNDIAGNLLLHPTFFDSGFYYNIIQALQVEFEFYLLIALVFGFINKNKSLFLIFLLAALCIAYVAEILLWDLVPLV